MLFGKLGLPSSTLHLPSLIRRPILLPTLPCLQVSALPAEVKALLPPGQAAQPQLHLRISSLPPGAEAACWRLFHAALEPLYQPGKLGLVVFQFHLSFVPSQQNLQVRLLGPAERECGHWVYLCNAVGAAL